MPLELRLRSDDACPLSLRTALAVAVAGWPRSVSTAAATAAAAWSAVRPSARKAAEPSRATCDVFEPVVADDPETTVVSEAAPLVVVGEALAEEALVTEVAVVRVLATVDVDFVTDVLSEASTSGPSPGHSQPAQFQNQFDSSSRHVSPTMRHAASQSAAPLSA